jgi:hypothetical protein
MKHDAGDCRTVGAAMDFAGLTHHVLFLCTDMPASFEGFHTCEGY